MQRLFAGIVLLVSGAVAEAQQQPDPQSLQRAVSVLQAQRNAAYDAQANSEMRALGLQEELDKLRKELEALKAEKK